MKIFGLIVFILSVYVLALATRQLLVIIRRINFKERINKKTKLLSKLVEEISKNIKNIRLRDIRLKNINREIMNIIEKQKLINLILIADFTLLLISYILYTVIYINALKNFLLIIIIITFWVLCILMNIVESSDEMPVFNFERTAYLYIAFIIFCSLVAYGYVYLGMHRLNREELVGAVMALSSASILFLLRIVKYFKNKFFIIIFTIPIYFIMIGALSFIFGVYYYAVYKINFDLINHIAKSNDFFALIKIFVKVGIQFFYNYPSDNYFGLASIFQFMLGKLIDLFMLGYIFDQVIKEKKDKNKLEIQKYLLNDEN